MFSGISALRAATQRKP